MYIRVNSYTVYYMDRMKRYLVRVSGEVSLKGRYRGVLEKILEERLRSLVQGSGSVERIDGGRFFIESLRDVSRDLVRIFGVHEVLEVDHLELTGLEDLASRVGELYCREVSGKRFAVRVRRVGTHSFSSIDVARVVGERLRECGGLVDLERPEVSVYIEIRGRDVYVTTDQRRLRGPGGLPLGSSDRVLVLFSGGFDSTVATWLLMRRGSPTDLLYIQMGSLENMIRSLEVAEELVKRWSIGYSPRVYIADFSEAVREVREKIRPVYWQISLRRLMYLVAVELARRQGYRAIATGESIWEANSQTIANLSTVSRGIDFLILRPVIGLSKEDITRISIEIGLYDKISRVRETCWLGAAAPVRVDEERFLREFEKISSGLVEKIVREVYLVDLSSDWRDLVTRLYSGDIVIDKIPEGSIVVDLTGRYVGKKSIGVEIHDLREIEKYRDRDIVLVCEEGELSELLARELRKEGYRAYSLRGGLRSLRDVI